ncbi:MAG: hypothetical protein KJ971_07385 [Firmicutes bacterium]|nr:hypothetical protein [Bacillota bacterium]
MKRILMIGLFFTIVLLISGCSNNQDIIQWTYDDDLLDWQDVEGAQYYQIIFYDDDLETETDNGHDYMFYAYGSEFSFFLYPNEASYHVKIKIIYEDETFELSDIINVSISRQFNHPTGIGSSSATQNLEWQNVGYGLEDFINYTVKVNDDEEYNVEEAMFEMSGFNEGVYKVEVCANYTDGTSKWSSPFYANINVGGDILSIYYDTNSNEDFSYTFDEEVNILSVRGNYNFDSFDDLTDDIVQISDSTITINHYYIQNEGNLTEGIYTNILHLLVVSDNQIYTVYLVNHNED